MIHMAFPFLDSLISWRGLRIVLAAKDGLLERSEKLGSRTLSSTMGKVEDWS